MKVSWRLYSKIYDSLREGRKARLLGGNDDVVVENLQRKGYFGMVFGFGLIPKFMEMMRFTGC